MSLDVYLALPGVHRSTGNRIYIREDGQTKELTRAEWDMRFPDQEPITMSDSDGDEVYTANITHNLTRMADAAGIYEALWRPEEIGIKHASQLIAPLQEGLKRLEADPEHFKLFNPSNGWGSYEGFVHFVKSYLAACVEYPDAEVSVWV